MEGVEKSFLARSLFLVLLFVGIAGQAIPSKPVKPSPTKPSPVKPAPVPTPVIAAPKPLIPVPSPTSLASPIPIINYFNNDYEIFEPRIVPGTIEGTETVVVVEIKYQGYYQPVEFNLQLQYENETIIATNIPTKTASVSSNGKTIALKNSPSTSVTQSKLFTKKELDISDGQERTLYTVSLSIPITFFWCYDIFLNLRMKMSRTIQSTVWTPFPPLVLPWYCKSCYSYAGQLMAKHGQILANCGGRSCNCFNGILTCSAKCKRRQAWHTMSAVAKIKYINAINWLNSMTSTNLGNLMGTGPLSYYSLLQKHQTISVAHWTSRFLPWHRLYLCEYERMLQLYDVCVTVPFWYHPIDSTGNQYHVLDDSYLGDEIPLYGLLNNPWNVPPSFSPFSRGGSNSNAPLASATAINTLLSSASFSSFTSAIEGSIHHYTPHNAIGGSMGSFQSPADPFFWLHHCMVDRNWQLWRNLSPINAASYSGLLTDSLPPWGYQVNDVINNLGVMAATTTQYPGTNKIPIGDHCSVCYRPIFIKWWWWDFLNDIMHTVNFRNKDLDTILVEKFSPEELKKRKIDDYWVLEILKANQGYTQDDLIKMASNGCNFNLPKEVMESVEKLNLNVNATKIEFCDIILTPIFEGIPVTLLAALDDVDDRNPVCGAPAVNYAYFELLVTEELLKERLTECPNTKDF